MKEYLKEAGNIHLSYYLEAADKLGIKYEVITRKLIARFQHENKHWFIINTVTPLINSPGKTIAVRKNLTCLILSKANIPTPKQESLATVEDAISFYRNNKKIVLKPKQGIGGKGVSILPESEEEVVSSYNFAYESDYSNTTPKVLAEKYIVGENFRLLVLGDKVIGIVKRLKPYIKGDGENSVQNLILRKKPSIPMDYETIKVLERQKITLESIPKAGEKITVRNNTNLSTGGQTEEFSEYTHPYYKNLAVKAVKAIGLKFGGVDIIAEDITKPGNCAINEINYNPGLRIHYKVDKGKKVKVAIPIMEYIRDNEL